MSVSTRTLFSDSADSSDWPTLRSADSSSRPPKRQKSQAHKGYPASALCAPRRGTHLRTRWRRTCRAACTARCPTKSGEPETPRPSRWTSVSAPALSLPARPEPKDKKNERKRVVKKLDIQNQRLRFYGALDTHIILPHHNFCNTEEKKQHVEARKTKGVHCTAACTAAMMLSDTIDVDLTSPVGRGWGGGGASPPSSCRPGRRRGPG